MGLTIIKSVSVGIEPDPSWWKIGHSPPDHRRAVSKRTGTDNGGCVDGLHFDDAPEKNNRNRELQLDGIHAEKYLDSI